MVHFELVARERRLAFGEVAQLYDRRRPSYPRALVADVLELAGLDRTSRVLEVGAGTGKATVLFAPSGVSLLALEPSPPMAALARRQCARFANVEIEESEFERWEPGGSRFQLLYAATAWHWLEPELRYRKARSLLRPGGLLAAFWNRPDWAASPQRDALREAYRRAAPELLADGPMHPGHDLSHELLGDWRREIEQAPGLARPQTRDYRCTYEYSAAEYAELLQTHSDHLLLPEPRRRRLLSGVASVIERNGGTLRIDYVTRLCLARAC
ncbi:MAG: class I SAM-dependent methyltransferase [Solirubrobacterales bacterium]|nr:class I SAM-dependent methyltransferase [Solirubrobacterales bacterium]MBV9837950.1 class I SAM-dependent methyltransferase [Solirubrobacterales bacterium]